MTRLILVQLGRFRSRQAATWLLLLAVVFAVMMTFKIGYDTRPLTSAEVANAAKQAQLGATRGPTASAVKACQADPEGYLGPQRAARDCISELGPEPEDFYPRQELAFDPLLNDAGMLPGDGVLVTFLVGGFLLVSAAMFAGSDYHTGEPANELLMVPSRSKHWLSKALAVTIWSLLHALLILGAFWLALWLLAQSRGQSPSASDFTTISLFALRSIAVVAGAALGAFALTVLTKHTIASLGLVFVGTFGVELLVNFVPIAGAGRWSPANNVFGWLVPGHRYFDATITCGPSQGCSSMQTLEHLPSGLYLLLLLAVVCAFSFLSYRRQDF